MNLVGKILGEVMQSFEEAVDVVVVEKEERENEERNGNTEDSSSMMRWERFLPRMGLRVLLVEADDSTRQIIGALLRKCNYKVATVPDGLKAWEVLKARPHNVDLILTEVELPLISGYALLTLIMEQEICKDIPVIMMSKYDSVSMVYKCMLKGAADFLVKPIRINELKNLWQHVWRRQSLKRGLGPQDESIGQQKLEATAENNATSDHSSSSKACAARPVQCIKKGSDAQSSCGQPDLEVESADIVPVKEHPLQPDLGKSPVSDSKLQENSNCDDSDQNLSTPKSPAVAEDNAAYNNDDTIDEDGRMNQQNHRGNVSPCAGNIVEAPANSSREPIDLLGALDGHPGCNSFLNDRANKFDSPQLDLSLRRLYSGVLENNTTCEKQMLNHSNASAFTRYINKTLPTFPTNPTSVSNPQEDRANSGDHFCEHAPCSTSSAQEPLFPHDGKLRSSVSLPTDLTKEVEDEYRNVSQRLFPIPFPARGLRVDVCPSPAGYGSGFPPTVCTPSPSSPSPSSANHHMNSFHQFSVDIINGGRSLENRPHFSNQPIMKEDQRLESLENRVHFSPTADQSATSTLCNSNAAHQEAVGSGGCDNGNDQIQTPRDLNLQRFMQREAALNKFRLKRKERCYEKKVRYESRKKLAEQRPRVKGQFVRQVPPDPPPCKSDDSGGNSAHS